MKCECADLGAEHNAIRSGRSLCARAKARSDETGRDGGMMLCSKRLKHARTARAHCNQISVIYIGEFISEKVIITSTKTL